MINERYPADSPSNSKSKSRLGSIACLGCLLIGGLIAASPVLGGGLELEARYWQPEISGGGALELEGIPVDIELGQDLGLDVDGSLEGRFMLRPGAGFFLRARYQNLSAEGSRGLDFDFDLGPIGLQVQLETESLLDFDYAGFAIGWQLQSKTRSFRLGPFIEAKGVRGDSAILVSVLGRQQGLREDFEGGFLAFGGLLEVEPTDRLQFFAEVSVLVEDDEADLTDAEVGVRFFANDTVGFGGGYRILEISGSVDEVLLDLEYDGVFGSVMFRF